MDTSFKLPEELPEVSKEPGESKEKLSNMELDSLFTADETKEEDDIDILPKDFEDFAPVDKSQEMPEDFGLPEFDTTFDEQPPELEKSAISELDKSLADMPTDTETFIDNKEEDSFGDESFETDLLGEEPPEISKDIEKEDIENIEDLTEPETTPEAPDDFEMPDEFQMPPEEKDDEIPDIPDLDDSFLSGESFPEPDDISSFSSDDKEDIILSPDDELKDLGTGDEDFHIDEFTLPEIGEEFGIKDETTNKDIPDDLEAELPSSFELPTDSVEADEITDIEEGIQADEVISGQREFTEKEFSAIQNTLNSLPLNLKITVEELIGEEQISSINLQKILDYLVQRRSAKEIAALVSKITGKKISIPKRFEKRTGIQFEEERKTFAYAFKKNIVPIIKVMFPALIVLAILVYGTIYLIILPLWSNDVYQQGYDLLMENRFNEANEKFDTAFRIVPEQHWLLKDWFYRYAEGFEDRKQYDYAREKYHQLLNIYPDDRQGALDWAGLESGISEYEESNRILHDYILERKPFDYDALLLTGDNYFNWVKKDLENSELHLDDARTTYERLILQHGDKDTAWLHMLRYSIYIDNYPQTMSIKDRFDNDKNAKVDPEIYSELAGYLIDRQELDEVDDILNRAREIDKELPEIAYQYSRYYKEINNPENEEKALLYVIDYLINNQDEPLSTSRKIDRLIMQINSYNRMGEIYAARGLVEDAEEKFFNVAIELIENGQAEKGAGILDYSEDFGKVYYNKGDLYYYYDLFQKGLDPDTLESIIYDENTAGDLSAYSLEIALHNYLIAERNNYHNPELDYKIGYINYTKEEFQEAFLRLYNLRSIYNTNPNFIYALGNILYNKRDYFGAQGYFKYLIELLEQKEKEIVTLDYNENPKHEALINSLEIAYNNLGVIFTKLAQAPRDPEKETAAKVQFIKSAQYADIRIRDEESLQRGLQNPYGYLNTQEILKLSPTSEYLFFNILPLNPQENIWIDYEGTK